MEFFKTLNINNMKNRLESKIYDVKEDLEMCELASEINEDEELEPAFKDLINAKKKHISDLEWVLENYVF